MASRPPLALFALLAACRPAGATSSIAPAEPPAANAEPAQDAASPAPAPLPTRALVPAELGYVRVRSLDERGDIPQLVFVQEMEDELDSDTGPSFEEHPTADDARARGLPEVSEVWLFGPDGPCRARQVRIFADHYEDVVPTLELGWELEACADEFAPVAHLGPSPPALRWIDAEVRHAGPLERASWKDPLADALEDQGLWEATPDDTGPQVDPSFFTRVAEAGPVVELSYAQHWPGDACEEYEHTSTVIYAREGEALIELPTSDEIYGSPELVGALVDEDGLVATVATHAFQIWIGTGPLEPDRYRWTEIHTGNYHEEDTAYWAWSVLEAYCGP